MVAEADTTLSAIRRKVRRLTASPNESSLTTNDIDTYINTFYLTDFPYAIKLDQMRSVYTFYTEPYVDVYPLDVNYNQGVRAPLYIDGIPGTFFKDRTQFYNMWPKYPTYSDHSYSNNTSVSFTINSTPFLAGEVTIGGTLSSGEPISICDDGSGLLLYSVPNSVIINPSYIGDPSIPGMHNANNSNPGLKTLTSIGTVNYVTGEVSFTLTGGIALVDGGTLNVRVSQYQTGRPYSCLFWNNEFIVRPVPSKIHKCEIETYLSPVQFLETSDNPILRQWWEYIALGAAIKILEDRQDMEGKENLMPIFLRQEALILERQGVEEINQRNTSIYSSTTSSFGWNNWQGWY